MNSPSFDLAIFDCDGVLVDSEPLANRIFVQIVHEHGFEVDEPAYLKKFSGITLPDRINAIARELDWEPPQDFLDLFNERLGERRGPCRDAGVWSCRLYACRKVEGSRRDSICEHV